MNKLLKIFIVCAMLVTLVSCGESDNEIKDDTEIELEKVEENIEELNNSETDIKEVEDDDNVSEEADNVSEEADIKEEGNKDISSEEDITEENNIEDSSEYIDKIINLADIKNSSDYEYKITFKDESSDDLFINIEVMNDVTGLSQNIEYQSNFNKEWYDMYTENGGEIVRFFDMNFDGNYDIILQIEGAFVNQSYLYYLYNTESSQFEISENIELENLINPKVDIENKLFLSTSYNTGIPSYKLLESIDGEFKLLGSIKGYISDNGGISYEENSYAYLDKNNKINYKEEPEILIANNEEEINSFSELWNSYFKLDFVF